MLIEVEECRRMPAAVPPVPAVSRPVLAAIDLGTNNCRLLVARPHGPGFRVVDAFSRIVRLGEGLSRSDALSETAMTRTLAALSICATKIQRRGVTASRVVATEACRRAANCRDFVERVALETGLEIEIIPASEEARLALAGCAPLLDRHYRHALVFDIGGGSTELMWIDLQRGPPMLLDQVSLPLGVVGLAERYGGDVVPDPAYQAMMREVATAIAGFEARNAIADAVARGAVHMVGISGTVTTLAGIHLGLPRYQRALIDGLTLRTDHARAVADRLRRLDFHARAAYPCIGRERADLVVAGCAVLEAICDTWPVASLRIADRGLREGILLDLLAAA